MLHLDVDAEGITETCHKKINLLALGDVVATG
jgi:hypothetical protein